MVVTYSIKELRSIGEEMRNREKVKDLVQVLGIAAKVAETIEFNSHYYVPTIQKLFDQQKQLNAANNNNLSTINGIKYLSQIEPIFAAAAAKIDEQQAPATSSTITPEESTCPDSSQQEPVLTKSVADFFRKVQQNFNYQEDVDATKVRRLSEVEAELIANIERTDTS